jgi:hypothetical protein
MIDTEWFQRLGRVSPEAWVAIYAAFLSTITGLVQIRDARRSRTNIRLKLWWEEPSSREIAIVKHLVVRVSNTGERPLPIFRPQLELTNYATDPPRRVQRSPSDEYDDLRFEWIPLDDPGPEEPFELKATQTHTYRFTFGPSWRILAVQVVDRAHETRYRRRTFWGPMYFVAFWVRHRFWRLRGGHRRGSGAGA